MDRDAGRKSAKPEKERTLAIDKDVFAQRLWRAIKRSGLTYRETAERAQTYLPAGQRISDVSVWSYAKGRSLPRRRSHIEALAQVLGVTVESLVEEVGPMRDDFAGRDTSLSVDDLGEGRARLRVTMDVPWETALAVVRILRAETPPEGGAPTA